MPSDLSSRERSLLLSRQRRAERVLARKTLKNRLSPSEYPTMSVSDVQKTQALLRALQAPEATREQVEVSMLKKALDTQKEEADALLRLLEGKGQVIDIRV